MCALRSVSRSSSHVFVLSVSTTSTPMRTHCVNGVRIPCVGSSARAHAHLDHLSGVVHRPRHDLLPCLLALLPKASQSTSRCQPSTLAFPESSEETYRCPSQLASAEKFMEKTSQLSQKYFLPSHVLHPMKDRLQYGRIVFAGSMKRGCQRPSTRRGASSVCQFGCPAMISWMSVKSRVGSLNTFTSILNWMCRFSGCACGYG